MTESTKEVGVKIGVKVVDRFMAGETLGFICDVMKLRPIPAQAYIRHALKKARKENEKLRGEIAELCDGGWKRRNAE